MDAISPESISSLQSALVRQRIDTAVLAKTHEAAKQQAEAVIGLLDAAGATAGETSGSDGRHLDITA